MIDITGGEEGEEEEEEEEEKGEKRCATEEINAKFSVPPHLALPAGQKLLPLHSTRVFEGIALIGSHTPLAGIPSRPTPYTAPLAPPDAEIRAIGRTAPRPPLAPG
ncbi:hypothetical protein E2C01_043800 [Portunus trituberculatus]|uniref:Uncharacterized protein n=1 Tax=Portunus trituberculatus TaxID=210409 RepID=A0A5B7FTW2_PORTR|nr:hypothetical protein [Portunus trituberculatus]